MKGKPNAKATMTVDADPHKGLSHPTPVEKLKEVEVLPGGKKLKIGSALFCRVKTGAGNLP